MINNNKISLDSGAYPSAMNPACSIKYQSPFVFFINRAETSDYWSGHGIEWIKDMDVEPVSETVVQSYDEI